MIMSDIMERFTKNPEWSGHIWPDSTSSSYLIKFTTSLRPNNALIFLGFKEI